LLAINEKNKRKILGDIIKDQLNDDDLIMFHMDLRPTEISG